MLPGLKLEQPIFTTALPVPGHERVNVIQKIEAGKNQPKSHFFQIVM